MGGAVVSLMEWRNWSTMCPNQDVKKFNERLQNAGGSFIRELPGTETENTSATFVLADYDEEAHQELRKAYNKPSFYATTKKTFLENPDKEGMGYRPIDRFAREEVVDPATGKSKAMDITYYKPTVRVTLGTVWERVEAFGRGLTAIGASRRSNVAIFMETCLEWFVSIYGIWSQDMVTVTVYANLGHDALAYALHETGSAGVVCSGDNAVKIGNLIRGGAIPALPIIYNGNLPAEADFTGLEIYSFDDILELGRETTAPSVENLNSDDLALIMYTSGTTGDPKGVMHTHGSLVAGCAFLNERVVDLLGSETHEDDSYCSFLPMAHVMEFCVTSVFVQRGSFIGFGSPRTLTDATARPHGDLTEFKPNLLVGVPRIFDTLKKTIQSKLPPVGSLKRQVFDTAFATRAKALKEGYDTPYYNEKVFSNLRSLLGGRASIFLAGGGPLSAESQEFMNVCFGQLVVGYGLTETVCVGGIQTKGDFEPCTTGLILPGMEYKLLDTEHYKHTDMPHPSGELLERGPHLFKGYYKQPELTKEAIDEDGWYHTGDIAALSPDGKLRLIGRVKALAKNCLGEYIALENLEAIYGNNALLQPNGVCVLVDPDKSYVCAIGLTDEGRALAFAKENQIEGEYPEILKNPKFQEAAAKSLAATAKAAKRPSFELVKHVLITNDVWSPENDVLTAAMKLKRRVIDQKYASEISELFRNP